MDSDSLSKSLQQYYTDQAVTKNHYLNKSSKSVKESGQPLPGDAQVRPVDPAVKIF